GGSVNIRAGQIEIGYIRTGSMRTATPTTNGNVQLLALAPPDYNVGNRYGNMISNSLVLKGEIDTHGGHPETTGGDVILAGVQLALETNFALTTPQEVLVSVNAGEAQGDYSESDLFLDNTSGGSGIEVDHTVLWSSPSFRVLATDPPDGTHLISPPTSLTVRFSQVVDATSVQAEDLRVNADSATGVEQTNEVEVLFALPSLTPGTGEYSVEIAEGAILSASGIPIEPYSGSFRILEPPEFRNQEILEVGAFGIRIGGEVTQSPNVRFYYGKQDGGTDPEKWSHVRDYGEFSDGPIEVSLFGLEPVTEYYLRARVSNGVGDSWADESLHVATLTDEEIEEASTVALWLFDETDYSYTTLLDA
ncbi:MAG: hypothetical protein KC964_17710, partial [Candidatus Omnitrophica bacterium]|nr:hypothetical protein [Candidatus Omnitrophota bacterium]